MRLRPSCLRQSKALTDSMGLFGGCVKGAEVPLISRHPQVSVRLLTINHCTKIGSKQVPIMG
jgi:hypothetical protein